MRNAEFGMLNAECVDAGRGQEMGGTGGDRRSDYARAEVHGAMGTTRKVQGPVRT
jgi:hypothetical protein